MCLPLTSYCTVMTCDQSHECHRNRISTMVISSYNEVQKFLYHVVRHSYLHLTLLVLTHLHTLTSHPHTPPPPPPHPHTPPHPHPSPFPVCNRLLSSGGYFMKNDVYYCSKDYHTLFGTKCLTCGEYVEGRVVTALGKSYHPHCFTCDRCK